MLTYHLVKNFGVFVAVQNNFRSQLYFVELHLNKRILQNINFRKLVFVSTLYSLCLAAFLLVFQLIAKFALLIFVENGVTLGLDSDKIVGVFIFDFHFNVVIRV